MHQTPDFVCEDCGRACFITDADDAMRTPQQFRDETVRRQHLQEQFAQGSTPRVEEHTRHVPITCDRCGKRVGEYRASGYTIKQWTDWPDVQRPEH